MGRASWLQDGDTVRHAGDSSPSFAASAAVRPELMILDV